MSSILLLLYLLPPSAGRKKIKISPLDAVDRLVHFHKVIYQYYINVFSMSYTVIDGIFGFIGTEGSSPVDANLTF